MTVTMMDDPVLILAEREKLIEKLPADVTNLADVLADAKPRGAMWANWCQPMCSASHNTKSVPNGLASYADAWDKKYKEKIVDDLDAHHAGDRAAGRRREPRHRQAARGVRCRSGRPGFEKLKELKPNILQVSAQVPQLQQLLESGEVDLYLSPDSRTTLFRKSQGAPVEQSYPKEGVFAMPAGVALVKAGRTRISASSSSTRCSPPTRRR